MNFILHSLLPTLAWYKLYLRDKWVLMFSIIGGLFPDAVSAYEKVFVDSDSWVLRNWAHDWWTFTIISLSLLVILYLIKKLLTSNYLSMWFIFSVSYALHIVVDMLVHVPVVGGWYWWAYYLDYGLLTLLIVYFFYTKEWPWTWFMNKK